MNQQNTRNCKHWNIQKKLSYLKIVPGRDGFSLSILHKCEVTICLLQTRFIKIKINKHRQAQSYKPSTLHTKNVSQLPVCYSTKIGFLSKHIVTLNVKNYTQTEVHYKEIYANPLPGITQEGLGMIIVLCQQYHQQQQQPLCLHVNILFCYFLIHMQHNIQY